MLLSDGAGATVGLKNGDAKGRLAKSGLNKVGITVPRTGLVRQSKPPAQRRNRK